MNTPYIDTLKATIAKQIFLLSLLENRIDYLKSEIDGCQSENYHINEARINIIKTQAEIETLEKVIAEKQDYFEKFAAHFEKEFAEMEKNYDKLMENARLKSAKNPVLKSLFDKVNKDSLKNDKEAKLFFYKKVKEQMA